MDLVIKGTWTHRDPSLMRYLSDYKRAIGYTKPKENEDPRYPDERETSFLEYNLKDLFRVNTQRILRGGSNRIPDQHEAFRVKNGYEGFFTFINGLQPNQGRHRQKPTEEELELYKLNNFITMRLIQKAVILYLSYSSENGKFERTLERLMAEHLSLSTAYALNKYIDWRRGPTLNIDNNEFQLIVDNLHKKLDEKDPFIVEARKKRISSLKRRVLRMFDAHNTWRAYSNLMNVIQEINALYHLEDDETWHN